MSPPSLVLDTSAAVPLLLASHPAHGTMSSWATGRPLSLTGHSLAETYSVLTRLPGDARLSPTDAVTLIEENFESPALLPAGLAAAAHRELAAHGIAGGAAYDGLVALAARENGAVLATRDARARPTYEVLGAVVEIISERHPR